MCGPNCYDGGTLWKPRIKQSYRSPRGGWSIQTMPDTLAPLIGEQQYETMSWAWTNRPKRKNNADAASAVQEMTELLRRNNHQITSEIRQAIRDQADAEWCAASPERCPKVAQEAPLAVSAPNAKKAKTKKVGVCKKC